MIISGALHHDDKLPTEQATGLKLHLTADLEFHLSIARATHNPLFPALLKPIAALRIETSLKILRTQRLQDPKESVILH